MWNHWYHLCGTTGIICVERLVSSVWNHWYHLCGTTGIIYVEPLVSSVWNHRSLPSCLVLTCLSVWLPAFGVCAISFIMEGSSWLIENGLMEIIFFCPLSIWDPSPKIRCWQELGLGLGIRATNFRGHLHLRPTSKTIYHWQINHLLQICELHSLYLEQCVRLNTLMNSI